MIELLWKCTFCKKEAFLHTMSLRPGKHSYLCKDCFNQLEGFASLKNRKLKEFLTSSEVNNG